MSLLAAVLLFLRTRRFLSTAVAVSGTVMDMVARSGSEGGVVYSPVVQFTTVEGQAVTFTDSVGRSPPKYTPGDTVKVMYPPGRPEAARIPGWFSLWFLPSFSLLFGLIFGVVGGFLYMTADEATTLPGGIEIPEGVAGTEIPPGLIPSGVVPSLPAPGAAAGGSVLIVSQGAGAPSTLPATCESIRDRGKAREVKLGFQGGSLTFRASPYTGPGPYLPGSNLEVNGTVFEGETTPLTGAVVFDESGQSGAVNLVAGNRIASGSWACSELKP